MSPGKEGGAPPCLDSRGRPFHVLEAVGDPHRVAVIYPGRNYTPMAPLLFVLDQALEAAGWSVIAIDYRYSEDPEFQAASDDEKDAWVEADALAVGRWVARRTQGCRVVYVGKSLGTSMLLHQVNAGLVAPDAELVWLTPGTKAPEVYQALRALPQRSFVAYGTADPYAPQGAQRPEGLPRVTLFEVPGAGHIFEVPGDVRRSLNHIADVVEAVVAFVEAPGDELNLTYRVEV